MTLHLGLVGRGPWAKNVASTLQGFDDVSVVHVDKHDRTPDRPDAALIVTPSSTHAELALRYIEAGIPTFIEKPMTTSITDAERLAAAAVRTGTFVFVGHLYLHHPAFLTAVDLLPEIGAVRSMHCIGMNGRPRSDSSVLWDWLPHHLVMAGVVFGCEPTEARAWSPREEGEATARFRYGESVMTAEVSWLSLTPRQSVQIVGEHKTLVFDDKAGRKLMLTDTTGAISYPSYSAEPPLTRELRAFVDAVRSGTHDPGQVRTGIAVVQAIAAAEESLRTGTWRALSGS